MKEEFVRFWLLRFRKLDMTQPEQDVYKRQGYGYGKKKVSNRGLPKFYMELAGKDFWTELTLSLIHI